MRGWDIAVLWSQGRWRFLLNIVDHLPRNTAYGDALAQDDELFEDYQPSGAPSGPLVQEWSPEVDALAHILDVLLLIRAEQWSLAGQKAPKFKPTPRPHTALDRLEVTRRDRSRKSVEAFLFPDEGGDDA